MGRTSFCLKCDAQLLGSSLQSGKVRIVAQDVIRLCGEHGFRCLGVETAAGHFRRNAVTGHDAGHAGIKGSGDHTQAVAFGLRRRAHDDCPVQHKERCPGRLRRLFGGTDAAHDLRVGQTVQ